MAAKNTPKNSKKTFISDISKQEFPESELASASMLRATILRFIQKEHPQFDRNSKLAIIELNYYREKYISDYLVSELGELSLLEETVLSALHKQSTLADKLDGEKEYPLTFGQRLADKVASFGGSWTFIVSFGVFLFAWICINVYAFANKGFDPYPFILLNLILSCIAALQAPVIMMSQNRQEEKDRERAKKDYMINLKAELEIRILHEKIDHLIMHQQQELMEVQKVQIDTMNDILNQIKHRNRA